MLRFLSPEWLAALGAATAGSERLRQAAQGVDLTLRQVVLGGPEGDVAYTVRLAHGTATVNPADGEDGADLEMVQDYDTAAAISRGELTPASAFAAGRLKVGGSVGLLVRHNEVATGLGDLFASLRAETSY